MRRVFWVVLGATAGVLVVRKLTNVAHSVTPEGAADRMSEAATGLSQAIREFAEDVRAGMSERESELLHALGAAPEDAVGTVSGEDPNMPTRN